ALRNRGSAVGVRRQGLTCVTAGAPVVLTTIEPRPHSFYGGFGNADALVIFPLTQSCALLMHGKEGSFAREQGDRGFVRKTNLRVASHCERFVVGRDGQLLRSLADSQGFLACSGWKPQRYVWSRKRPAKSFLYRAV